MAKKFIGAVVVFGLLGGLSWIVYALSANKVVVGYNQGYMPDQPIPYSHELHAGQLKIDCKYCHTSVEVTRHASIPSLNICMNCHLQVSGTDEKLPGNTETNKQLIAKVVEAYTSGKSIAWNKVHMLPDFVKFNHAPHIKAGKQCQECHGPVETMQTVYQYSSLSMGWCVNCHRKPENNAPTNCGTCHY